MKRTLIFGAIALLLLAVGGLTAFGLGYLPLEPEPIEIGNVSPAAAAAAEVKLAQLDAAGEEVRLTSVELTSLFRYRPEIWSLGIVREPAVRMSGDTLRVSGRVATADLPSEPEIDQLRPLLPDTVPVDLFGSVRPLGPSTTVLEIGAIEVAAMPIPARYYTHLLQRLGQGPENNLPPGTLALPLPAGIGSARIEGGELVLNR